MASISSKKMIAPVSLLRACGEQVAHPGGADADVGVHEVRARQGEEGHARLARDGLGEQRLAGARAGRAGSTPRGMRAPTRRKRSGSLQEHDHLAELLDRLVAAGDVAEAHRRGRSTWAFLRMLAVAARRRRGRRADAAALRVAAPDEQHAADDEHAPPGRRRAAGSRRIDPAQARAGRRGGAAGLSTATPSARRRAARSKAPGQAPGASRRRARPAWRRLAEVAAGLRPRDLRRDDVAVAVDRGHPVAGGVHHGGVQVAGVGRPDQLR